MQTLLFLKFPQKCSLNFLTKGFCSKPFAFLEGSFLHNDNLSLPEVLSPGHFLFFLSYDKTQYINQLLTAWPHFWSTLLQTNQNYWVQKWKVAELFCGLFCHFLQKRSTNLAFLKEFCKNWQNNPQNNLATFHFGTQ